MANYLNMVSFDLPRNATNSHTVNPASSTTVKAGSTFTPTAGRMLVAIFGGAVTYSTPSGFTLPANGSTDGFGSVAVFYDLVAAGSDTIATTHNGTNYPCACMVLEYPAGSTFVTANAATLVAYNGGAGPSISSLTGTNDIFGAVEQNSHSSGTQSCSWASGTELVDTIILTTTTDGYSFGVTHLQDSVLTSSSIAATLTSSNTDAVERLMFAVKLPAAATSAPVIVVPRVAVHRAASW